MVKTLMTDTYFARGESRGGKDRRVLEKMAKTGAVLRRASITHTHTHTHTITHTHRRERPSFSAEEPGI